jgi:hypothetical protein
MVSQNIDKPVCQLNLIEVPFHSIKLLFASLLKAMQFGGP